MEATENPKTEKPCKRFFKYHWPGLFHFVTLFMLCPLVFLPPMKQNTVIYVWIVMFLWYVADQFPPGITALLPILIYPPMGVMPSESACMNYTQNANIVFVLSCFVAIAFEVSKTAERLAFMWIRVYSHRPRVLLISLMVCSWLLSTLVPNAVVCSLMMPLTKNIIQVLEAISVGKLFNENKPIGDDEPPYPTSLTNGFALGVAFASTIGGITTLSGSDVGITMYMEYKQIAPNAKGQLTYDNYLIVAIPLSFLLLIFTIFYLEIVFLGLFQTNSPDNLVYDNEASRNALNTAMAELPRPNIYNHLVILLYIILSTLCATLQPIYMDGLADVLNERSIKHSAVIMVACFAIFVLPNTYHFLTYCLCKEPAEPKTAPSLLGWPAVHKNMLWNYFLAFGGSLVLADSIKNGHWPIALSSFLGDISLADRVYYVSIAAVLTIMGADHVIAKHLYRGAARHYLSMGAHPGNALHAIMFGSQLSFLLPISSVANSFASGWFNIRTRYVLLAGIAPVIMGLILSSVTMLTLLPMLQPELSSKPY